MRRTPINKMPTRCLIWDRRHTAGDDKEGTVELRITHGKKQLFMSTGVRVKKKHWDKKSQMVNGREDAIELNKFLSSFVRDATKAINEQVEAGHIDLRAIRERFNRIRVREVDVFGYIEKRKNIRLYGCDEITKKRYQNCIDTLIDAGIIQKMDDMNDETIIKLDIYLKKKGMKASSRWSNYHRILNSFIIDAVNDGYLSKNPYKWVKIDKGNDRIGIERHLTIEEFKAIKVAEMPTESLQKVRDVFVFQTYTCLSYTDLANFDRKKIEEVKGKKVYTGKRNKTEIPFTVPLLPGALEILEKYKGKLPLISNVKYNLYLKEVAKAAGIDKPVTTHWARHTGATLLLNQGLPMEIVSKICGHSSIKMTEKIYAKLLDETVVKAVNKVEKKRKIKK